MNRLWICLAAVATLTMATTTQAAAAIFLATFQGTVISGADAAGMFGAPGDLSGRAFTATYTYNANLGQRTTVPGYDEIYGGSVHGATPTPLLSAVLTIGAVSDAFGGQYDGNAYTMAGAIYHAEAHETAAPANILFTNFIGAAPNTVDQLFSEFGGGYGFAQRNSGSAYYANLSPTSLTITALNSAAPEPASWAMMIVGFFGLGAMLRRRRGGLAA